MNMLGNQFPKLSFLSIFLICNILLIMSLYSLKVSSLVIQAKSLTKLRPARLFSTQNTAKFSSTDENFMKLALRQAQSAYRDREVPIGAVIVDENGIIIATSGNKVEINKDASAHAELEALKAAAKYLNTWRLSNCTLYTTLEPCPMCMGAIQHFRIKRVVFGANDLRLGSCGTYLNLTDNHPFHNPKVEGGLLQDESAILLRRFFQNLRAEKDRYGSYDLGRGFTHQNVDVQTFDL